MADKTVSADEFRALMKGKRFVGRRLVSGSAKTYSRRSDPPKRTRCGGIVKVIVDGDDCT